MILVWILLGLAGTVLLLLGICILRTLLKPARTSGYVPREEPERAMAYARKLSEMVRCDTTSVPGKEAREQFLRFHSLLEDLFPRVHAGLEKTEIDGNLLFYWKGRSGQRPLVLMSHQDVVPAEGTWKYPPFSGEIAEGKVWGRGASDTKCSLMAFFQAVEELLGEGFVPPQDVYLSSSCTEEWSGPGCPALVEEMKRRGVRPFLVVDEGGGIITEPIGGVPGNFAALGVYEKGKADVLFRASSPGGHASTPRPGSPIARLAAFVHEVETRSVFRRHMSPEVAGMFESLAPYAAFPLRLVFSNLWLFRPVLLRLLPMISAQAGAMIRTTIAFTMQSGSEAFNVMPQEATLGANMRFIPHQGMEESLKVIRRIAEKHKLEMEVFRASDYTAAADPKSPGFRTLIHTLERTFPGLPSMPYVMTGATDARHYQEICDCVVRFAPVIYGPEQMKGMHGIDENIEYNCLPGAVDFYRNLIRDVGREEG